jgi:hypothetical protein
MVKINITDKIEKSEQEEIKTRRVIVESWG